MESPPLRVERVAVGGDGLAHDADGRVVFVRGGLPGELVDVRRRSTATDFAKADVVAVLEASPLRVAPPCPYVAQDCGGCAWQHVVPEAQLAMKVDIVRDALARQGRLPEAAVRAGGAVDPFAYRTTVRLGVGEGGTVGFRAGRSHRLVGVRSCAVAHPALASLLPGLRVSGADELTLRVGAATGERLAFAGRSGRIEGLPPDVAVGPGAAVHEDVAGHRFRVSARSFFQSSPQGAALLVDAVRIAASDGSPARLVDLYAGVGLFAATVGGDAEVVAVEQSASSVRDARHNLAGRAATLVEADVERWRPVPADLVIADPARTGLNRGGVAAVVGTGAPVVVLVSCDAAALGRDAALLGAAGYRHDGSTVLDLFPQTPHVEVVTRFARTVGA